MFIVEVFMQMEIITKKLKTNFYKFDLSKNNHIILSNFY